MTVHNALAEASPGIGHNAPPEPTDAYTLAVDRVKLLVSAANVWVAKIPKIKDETTAAACEDFLKQARDEWTAVNGQRAAEKEPHLAEADRIQALYAPLMAQLKAIGDMLKPLKAGWLTDLAAAQEAQRQETQRRAYAALQAAEDARKLAEGPARTVEAVVAAETTAKAAEDAMKTAAQADAAKPQVVGVYTGKASGFRIAWLAKVDDYALAAVHYAGHAKVREVIDGLANADARAMKEHAKVPGVSVYSEKRV